MMKILLATHFPEDLRHPEGGVEAVSVNLARALSKRADCDVHVVTFSKQATERLVKRFGKITVHYLMRGEESLLYFSLFIAPKILDEFIKELRPDILHSHDTYGLMVRNLDIPKVFTIHGFIYGDIAVSSRRFRLLLSTIWKIFETRGWRKHDALIAISPYVRERASRFGVKRIFDIDNPLSEQAFTGVKASVPGRIFCAAVISRRKNTLSLIRAVSKLLDRGCKVHLVLAGSFVESTYKRAIEQFFQTHNIEKFVDFLGPISADSVIQELRKASVFALVSREENSPMGIEEAMAQGKPIVASNRCGMPYMVKHGINGFLVNQECPAEIADALERIICDPGIQANFGRRSREYAKERYHPKVVADLTRAVYEETLERTKIARGEAV